MYIIFSDTVEQNLQQDLIELVKDLINDNKTTNDFIQFIEMKTDKSGEKLLGIMLNNIELKEKHTVVLNMSLNQPLQINKLVAIKKKQKIAVLSEKEFLSDLMKKVDNSK